MRLIIALVIALLSTVAAAQEAPALKTDKDKLSYALGLDLGTQFRQKAVDVDPAVYARGLTAGLSGGKALLTPDEVRKIVTGLQDEMRRKQLAQVAQVAEQNKKSSEAFLAANKKKSGITTLASGLQYQVLTAGTGKKPTVRDTVTCHYRGTFIDGKEFDSSYARAVPATFPVSGVVKGYAEALQLMSVGSKWRLFIPPELAYDSQGREPSIGPNVALVFEVELIAIK